MVCGKKEEIVGCILQTTKILARYAAPCLSREFLYEGSIGILQKLVFLCNKEYIHYISCYTHTRNHPHSLPNSIFFFLCILPSKDSCKVSSGLFLHFFSKVYSYTNQKVENRTHPLQNARKQRSKVVERKGGENCTLQEEYKECFAYIAAFVVDVCGLFLDSL